jgi:hypothetical protein
MFGLIRLYEQLLAEMGCRLNPTKLKCCIRPAYRNIAFLSLCADAGVPKAA